MTGVRFLTERDARCARGMVEMLSETFRGEPILAAAALFGRSASANSKFLSHVEIV